MIGRSNGVPVVNIKISTISALFYLKNEAQCPIFGNFLIFELFALVQALSLGHCSFEKKIRLIHVHLRVVRDFFIVLSSNPMINSM